MGHLTSFASQEELVETDAHAGIVHLVTGKTGAGQDFYAYISVLPSRYEDFMLISRAREQMDLSEFGEIIESGFGAVPPKDVRRKLESRYDIDFTFAADVKELAAQVKAEVQDKIKS